MHSHDSRGPDTWSAVEDGKESLRVLRLMRQTKPGAVITAQDVSSERLQKQEMRVNVVQSSVKGDIRSTVLELPQDKTRL